MILNRSYPQKFKCLPMLIKLQYLLFGERTCFLHISHVYIDTCNNLHMFCWFLVSASDSGYPTPTFLTNKIIKYLWLQHAFTYFLLPASHFLAILWSYQQRMCVRKLYLPSFTFQYSHFHCCWCSVFTLWHVNCSPWSLRLNSSILSSRIQIRIWAWLPRTIRKIFHQLEIFSGCPSNIFLWITNGTRDNSISSSSLGFECSNKCTDEDTRNVRVTTRV